MQPLLRLVFDADNRSVADKISFQSRLWLGGLRRALSRRDESQPFEAVLEAEVRKMLTHAEFRIELAAATATDDRIFLVVKTLCTRIFAHYVRSLQRTE